MPGGPRPAALVLMPGDPAPRPLTRDAFGNRLRLWDAQGRYALAEMAPGSPLDVPTAFQQANTRSPGKPLLDGLPFIPPPIFWSLLVPRQPAGSSALRSLDAAAVKRLLDAALADLPTPPQLGGRPQMPQAEKALAAVLPAVTEPRLRQAVLGALMLAARLVRQLEGLERRPDSPTVAAAAARRVPAVSPTEASPNAPVTVASPVAIARVIDDAALGRALVGLAPGGSYQFAFGGGGTGRPLEQLAAVATAMGSAKGARTSWRDAVGAFLGTADPASAKPASLPSSGIAWYSFIGRMGALALRAAMPTTNDDERAALVALLEALVTNGFPARRRETRLLTITRPRSGQVMPGVGLEWIGDHVLFVRQSYWTSQGAQLTGFEYAPGGRFELPKDATLIDEERPGDGWGDAATVSRFLELLAARGPVPWDPAAVDRLQRDTGLARAAAALLLATLPAIDDRSHNFLRNEVRAILDVKVADAKAARDLLQALPHARRLTLLDSAMPADPEGLWRNGLSGVAERLGAAWVASQGRRATVDDATLAAASKALAFQGSPTDPMRLLADPTDTRLTTEPPILMARGWTSEDPKAERFSAAIVRTLAIGIPWLHGAVQVGDGTLARLPEVLDVARQRLASPSLVLPMGWVQWPDFANSLQALGARRWSPPRGAQVEGEVMELGPYLMLSQGTADMTKVWLRPAALPGWTGADTGLTRSSPATRAPRSTARGSCWVPTRSRSPSGRRPRRCRPVPSRRIPRRRRPGRWRLRRRRSVSRPRRPGCSCSSSPCPLRPRRPSSAGTAGTARHGRRGESGAGRRRACGDGSALPRRARRLPDGRLGRAFGARPPGRNVEAAAVRRGAGRGRLGDDARWTGWLPAMPLHRLFEQAWTRWSSGDRPGFVEPPGRRRAYARMTDIPAKPAGGRQVDPAEARYGEELAFLAAVGRRRTAAGLAPDPAGRGHVRHGLRATRRCARRRAPRPTVCRPPEDRAKFVGDRALVERCVVTLAGERGLLLVGEPGTAKSMLSELLAAAISGTRALTVQGTAGTTEDQLRYGWNYALLIAEGPQPRGARAVAGAARRCGAARSRGSRRSRAACRRCRTRWSRSCRIGGSRSPSCGERRRDRTPRRAST